MSILFDILLNRIGNRLTWRSDNIAFCGELEDVEVIDEDTLLLKIVRINHRFSDGDYLHHPPELVTISSHFRPESLTRKGNINLVATDDSHQDFCVTVYLHTEPLNRI